MVYGEYIMHSFLVLRCITFLYYGIWWVCDACRIYLFREVVYKGMIRDFNVITESWMSLTYKNIQFGALYIININFSIVLIRTNNGIHVAMESDMLFLYSNLIYMSACLMSNLLCGFFIWCDDEWIYMLKFNDCMCVVCAFACDFYYLIIKFSTRMLVKWVITLWGVFIVFVFTRQLFCGYFLLKIDIGLV